MGRGIGGAHHEGSSLCSTHLGDGQRRGAGSRHGGHAVNESGRWQGGGAATCAQRDRGRAGQSRNAAPFPPTRLSSSSFLFPLPVCFAWCPACVCLFRVCVPVCLCTCPAAPPPAPPRPAPPCPAVSHVLHCLLVRPALPCPARTHARTHTGPGGLRGGLGTWRMTWRTHGLRRRAWNWWRAWMWRMTWRPCVADERTWLVTWRWRRWRRRRRWCAGGDASHAQRRRHWRRRHWRRRRRHWR